MRAAASASGLNCDHHNAFCTCRASPLDVNKVCSCLRDPNVNCSWGGDKIWCTYGGNFNFTCDEPVDCTTTTRSAWVCRDVGTSEMRFQFIRDDNTPTPCDKMITCTNVTIEPTRPPKQAAEGPTEKTGKSGTYVVV